MVNKSHIELELLRLCVSYLFGSFAEMLLPVTVRCSLWSQKQYIVFCLFLRAQHSLQKMYVFLITLYCENLKSYAIFKVFTVDYEKEFFNGLFRVVVKRRGETFHFPGKCWKIRDTLSWRLDFNTWSQTVYRIKEKKKERTPATWVLRDTCRHLQQNQLSPVVKMSLFCMCIRHWP